MPRSFHWHTLPLMLALAVPSRAATNATPFTVELQPGTIIETGSAADVSALLESPVGAGRPAQQHGILQIEGDQFRFEDGHAIRFWGANWPTNQPAPAGSDSSRLAQRLRLQGINLLRLRPAGTHDVGALRRFDELIGCLRGQGICLDLLLDGDVDIEALGRTNRVTRFAPRDDAGVAMFELAGETNARDALRRRGVRAPVAAAGAWRAPQDAAPLRTNDFLAQTAAWPGGKPAVKSQRTLFGPMSFGAPPDKPWLVGAWSAATTNSFRAELPLWTAATAVFQRWAGVCADAGLVTGADAVAWAWAPASALMFHRGDVATPHSKLLFRLLPDDKLVQELRSDHEQFSATVAIGLTRFTFEPAAADPFGWMTLRGVEMAGVAALNPRTSDTGEITHDWQAGQLRMDAPRTQALAGFIGGKMIETRELRLQVTNDFAVVALSSLDGKPIARSDRLLLTATGRADPSKTRRIEPVEGAVTLRWLAPSQHDQKVFALDFSGHRAQEVPLAGRGFQLRPELKAVWYEIINESLLPKQPPRTNAPPVKAELK
ncbi:MAG: hypothetical protein HZA91_17805 [Verrucomicrobia bacterium]|nr:hypothetical protein [Verrucomicrobiota bacterium]